MSVASQGTIWILARDNASGECHLFSMRAFIACVFRSESVMLFGPGNPSLECRECTTRPERTRKSLSSRTFPFQIEESNRWPLPRNDRKLAQQRNDLYRTEPGGVTHEGATHSKWMALLSNSRMRRSDPSGLVLAKQVLSQTELHAHQVQPSLYQMLTATT